MAGAAHRIGRLRLRLTAPDEAGYGAAARGFTDRFESQVLPALQAALDAIDRPDQVIRLERLELDLGRIDPAAPDFGPALRRALAAALRAGPAPPDAPPEASPATSAARAPLRSPDDLAADLVAFLRSGMLPWPAPGAALEALVAAVLALPPEALVALARRLLPALTGAVAARRFLLQLPVAALERIAAALAGWPAPVLPAVPPAYLRDPVAAALEPVLLALARAGGAAPQAVAFAAALAAPEAVAAAARLAAPGEPVAPPSIPDAPLTENPEPDPADSSKRHPVAAAGAVLLHPYLAAFFRSLGLTEANRFRDAGAQGRAVLLGQYLATGDETPAEPDCLLMKLLCGLPLATPLPRDPGIGAAERDEAETLLTAVIGHWGRLGAATPEGLRDGFLRRPGLLSLAGDSPVLTVERRTIDILLDRLPWTLGRVRTPFMDRVLAVEWV